MQSRHRLVAAASGLGLYAAALAGARQLGWQHLGLAVLAGACLAGIRHAAPRRFLGDWWPMIAFWLAYDGMRLWSDALLDRVAVREPFEWEARLFPAPGGTIWPFYLSERLAEGRASPVIRGVATFLVSVYYTQLVGIPLLLLALWTRGERPLFRRLVRALTALHAFTLPLWALVPAAPPWWVHEHGFAAPSPGRSMPGHGGDLAPLFRLNPNRFAAIPSLHGAYPVVLAAVLARHGAPRAWIALAAAYAVSMAVACVALDQHYIVDLILGFALAAAATVVSERWARRGGHVDCSSPPSQR